MKKILLASTCLTMLAMPAGAQLKLSAPIKLTAAPANCPMGTADPNDGCTGAQATGNYKITMAQFRSYAQVNGLTFSGSLNYHPMPWNLAGIDYPVGIPNTAFNPGGGYTLTPLGLKDASKSVNWSLDSMGNCSINAGANTVTCGIVNNPTIDGYDFSNTAIGCVRLIFNANVTGAVTIKNSYFRNADGSNPFSSKCDVANGQLITGSANANITAYTFLNNYIDGNGANFGFNIGQAIAINNTPGATFTFMYNACIHLAARCGVVNNGGNKSKKFNIFLGMTYPPSGTLGTVASPNYNTGTYHGEIFEDGTSGITSLPVENDDYNVILTVDESGRNGNRNTSAFFLTDGTHATPTPTSKWSLFTIRNNTVVAPPGNGANPISVTLASGGSGYANGDVIYTTPSGCGQTGPGIIIGTGGTTGGVINSTPGSNLGFFLGMAANGLASSGNGNCTTIPSNPVAQSATTGSGTGASFNFGSWGQQTVSAVFEGDGNQQTDVTITNNYVAVVGPSPLVPAGIAPPCHDWHVLGLPTGTFTVSGNVNWVTGQVMVSQPTNGLVGCQ